MNKQISEMLCASEGRYLTRAELASLRELAAQLEMVYGLRGPTYL